MKKKPTLRSLKTKAWKLFSEWIRRRDADAGGTVECFTCGKLMFWKEAHAGHAIPGRHNAVLLDEDIVKPQCPRDNLFLGGRYEVFTTKLIQENGMDWWLSKLEGAKKIVKLSRADYEEKINELKEKLEALG